VAPDGKPGDDGSSGRGGAADERGDGGTAVQTPGGKRSAAPRTASGGSAGDSTKGGVVGDAARELKKQLARVAKAIVEHPDKTVFPLALVFIVAGFLLVQGRLDRNDPKLALAPVFADADFEFSPPPTKR
jgi:hypothetical protein